MTKENIALDADKWDLYIIADFTVAFILVIVSMISAEIPRQRIEVIRQTAPYAPRGWTPSGQQFNLPLRSPPTPASSYGPPETESTTTEQPSTTEATTEQLLASQQAEKLEEQPAEDEKRENLEQPQQYYLVLPQEQNLIYTVPRSAALLRVDVPRSNLVAAPARLQVVPVSSAMTSSVYTPFGGSYIQIYQ